MNDQNVKIVSRIYYSAFRYEMDCLSDFHEKTENLLKRELKKFLLKSAQKISLLTKEEKIEYYDIVSDEDENLRKRFPYLLKSSNFLLFYGFFEAELGEGSNRYLTITGCGVIKRSGLELAIEWC